MPDSLWNCGIDQCMTQQEGQGKFNHLPIILKVHGIAEMLTEKESELCTKVALS